MAQNNHKNQTIVYVNFAPYENTGHILDFLKTTFHTVLLFSFNFHRLHQHHVHSTLFIYQKGKLRKTYHFFQIPTPPSLLFVFLPLRSVVLFFQLLYYCLTLNKQFGPYDVYFTVNAFTAWCGNIFRSLGLVRRTVFWVWDYYPPIHENKVIMFMRSLYWIFDKKAAHSDRLVFLNERLIRLRKTIGVLPHSATYPIVGIGTDPKTKSSHKKSKRIVLAFLGALKKSQGLDFIFDYGTKIHQSLPQLTIRVFGGGPDEAYFRHKAKNCPVPIKFFGYIPDSEKLDHALRTCTIGFAPYVPDPGNVSYYGDPSKIKAYMSVGLPVITTDVFLFSEEIKEEKAGILFQYSNPESFVRAARTILASYGIYRKGVLRLTKKYDFQKIYPALFE